MKQDPPPPQPTDIIPARTAGTLDGLFRERVRRSPGAVAYRRFERAARAWEDLSWAQMGAWAGRWQAALRAEGLGTGERVAVQLRNGPDWVAFEQAALGLGLVVVPLYVEDRPDNVAYILADAGVRLVLLHDAGDWERLAPHAERLEGLKRVVLLHGDPAAPASRDGRVRASAQWLPERGDSLSERGGNPDKLATIVYTSGTTGRPKGVMLSHNNILTNAAAALAVLDVRTDDTALSLLPLSHTFERTCGYYATMMAGCTVAYCRSVQQLAEDLASVRPTIMISVPRMFERIHARIEAQLAKQSWLRRTLYRLAVAVGWRRFLHAQREVRWSPRLVLWPALRRLVARRMAERLGGRLRLAVSGGAALPTTVARAFIGLGLDVVQGYGMTETSPIVSANTPDHNRPASVGRPLPGIAVRVGEHEELQVRGPNVMLGYWNNHRATSETIDAEGWLRTGDQAHIDEAGHIFITGRLKDILVMSNGEKVPPADMESAITLDPLFDQALVVGEARPFLGALVVLNAEHWVGLAREHELDPFDPASLDDRDLHHTLVHRVAKCLHDFPGYAKVRRVHPLLDAWDIDSGLLTPTLKVKRAKVLERFAGEVEAMYA